MRKLFFPLLAMVLFIACNNEKPAEKTETTAAAGTETKEVAQAEFADARYGDIANKGIDALSSGDIDAWMASYADNAVYVWNSGDSLAGKAAISAYWKKRRSEVIDSITFNNRVVLSIKVNKPQSVEAPGNWALCWWQTNAKYKTGKKMSQWIHTDMHFDANDKIDRVIQYVDRVPINEATKK